MEFNKEFFEILFECLDEPWGFSKRVSQKYRYNLTLELLKKHRERYASVLDIGCAQGQLTKELVPFADRITAIDISEKAIDRVRQDFAQFPQISFEVGCLPVLSYPDQLFDLAMAFEIVYYLKQEDRLPAMREVKRVLQDNGLFFISVIIGEDPYFQRDEIRELVGAELEIIHEEPLYLKLHQILEAKFFDIQEKITIVKKLISFSTEEVQKFFAEARTSEMREMLKKMLTQPLLKVLIKIAFYCFYAVFSLFSYPLEQLFRSMKFLQICNSLTKRIWGEEGIFQVIVVAQKRLA